MKNSILYFIFEGFSRGGIQFLLLFISYYFGENIYVTLLLLVSLETLVPLFFPTNYIDGLLPLLKKYSHKEIRANFFTLNILFFLVFLVVFFNFKDELISYFKYKNFIVYLLILLNVYLVRWLYFSAFMKQMNEKHAEAIRIKGIPFILSLSFAMAFVFIFEDKIFGFFLGKSFGLLIYYILIQEKIVRSIKLEFLIDFFNRSKFLLLTGLLGWGTGYGFLNVAHIFYTEIDIKRFGYMLNIYMIFLMVIFGVIQVVKPKILRLVEKGSSIKELLYFYFKIMLSYVTVALIGFLSISILKIIHLPGALKIIHIPDAVMNMIQNANLSILLFLLVASESTARIFIYAKDKIKNFTYIMVSVEILGGVLFFYHFII